MPNELEMIQRELSGSGLGGSGLGYDEDMGYYPPDIGDDELGVDELGAVRRFRPLRRRAPLSSSAQAQVRQIARKQSREGYGLLEQSATNQAAFVMAGSIALVVFNGTVNAGATPAPFVVQLDRKSTIREIRANKSSQDLLVTNFTAGGLPYMGLQFPISLESWSVLAQDRKVRAMTFEVSTRFALTLNNPTGQNITFNIELWGTAE